MESHESGTEPEDKQVDIAEARESLLAIDEARRTAVENSKAPAGYYPSIALGFGFTIVGLQAGFPWGTLTTILGVLIVMLEIYLYSNSVPTWAYGKIFGQGSWAFWILFLSALSALVVVLVVRTILASVIAAVLVVVVWAIFGPIWDRAYRRQLQQGDQA